MRATALLEDLIRGLDVVGNYAFPRRGWARVCRQVDDGVEALESPFDLVGILEVDDRRREVDRPPGKGNQVEAKTSR